jgi:hypothetical protein
MILAPLWPAAGLFLILAGFMIYQCFDAWQWNDRRRFLRLLGPTLALTAATGGFVWLAIAHPDYRMPQTTGFSSNYDCTVAKGVCAPTLPPILQDKRAPRSAPAETDAPAPNSP